MRECDNPRSEPFRNRMDLEARRARQAGNHDLAADLWLLRDGQSPQRPRGDVVLVAQGGGPFPGVREIADDFAEYLQFLHNGRTADARSALNQIRTAFANQQNYGLTRPPTQAERNEFARQLVALLRDRDRFPVLHFNLNGLQFAPGANSPSLIRGSVVHDLGGGRTENIPIRIAVDDRPDIGIAAAHMSGLIATMNDQAHPMNAANLSQTERTIWRAWNGLLPEGQTQNNLLPAWTAAPQAAGGGVGQPPIRAELNSRLAASHLSVEYVHRTNPLQPWLVADGWLRVTNTDTGAQVGNLIYVGSLTPEARGQLAARAQVRPRPGGEGGEGGGSRSLGQIVADWYSGLEFPWWHLVTLAGLGVGSGVAYGTYRGGRALVTSGVPWAGRRLGNGGLWVWNRLLGRPRATNDSVTTDSTAATTAATGETATGTQLRQTSEEATDVSARQPRPIEGATPPARARSVETALAQERAANPGSRFFDPQVLLDYRARSLEFANVLATETAPGDRAQQLTDFIRETGRTLFPDQAALFERIRVVENVHAHEGTVVADHTIVHGADGRVSEILISLPGSRLRGTGSDGRVSEANLHETLGSLYDQLYRVHRQTTLSAASNNDAAQATTRRSGHALGDYVQFSVREDNTVNVEQHANEARVALHSEHAVGGSRRGYMEIHSDGRMVVADERGREISDPEARERALHDQVRAEIERMRDAREAALRRAGEAGTSIEARTALQADAARLHTQIELAQARHATLTASADSTTRATARRTYAEAFREAYRRGRARYGGRLVPLAMFAEEAIRLWLSRN